MDKQHYIKNAALNQLIKTLPLFVQSLEESLHKEWSTSKDTHNDSLLYPADDTNDTEQLTKMRYYYLQVLNFITSSGFYQVEMEQQMLLPEVEVEVEVE